MKRCNVCGGHYKIATKRHVIKTRNPERPEFIIENLEVEQCVICGKVVIPENSEKMITIWKEKIKADMRGSIEQINENRTSSFYGLVKKLIASSNE